MPGSTLRAGARPRLGPAALAAVLAGCSPASPSPSTEPGDAGSSGSGSATSLGDGSSTAAASTDTSTETDTGTESDTDTGIDPGGDPERLVGSFQLQLTEPSPAVGPLPATPGGTTLFGQLYDGPTPSTVVWELAAEAGDCRLLTPRVPFCSRPCGGDAACVEDDTCQAYPSPVSAGDVLVTGVGTTSGATSFTMAPIANNYQPPAGTTLAYPAFAEGDEIALEAAGDELGAFALSAPGVAQLQLAADELALDPAADLVLEWTPPAGSASAIAVKLDISHHGGTKGILECEADDTGSLAIPASLVAGLIELGVAGFPSIVVSRRSTGSTVTALGRIDLVVSSQVTRPVLVDGVVSCSEDAQCPDGQTCQPDLTCQ
jgi:hypothetical protein